jgi:hypothetical protein
VEREGNLDSLKLMVEVQEQFFSDEVKQLEVLRKKITRNIQSTLGISVQVKLVEPKTIERTAGKAKRVIDNRKILEVTMIIKQLSVFLENKSGRLNEVSQLLGDAGINLSAISVADTSEFGILRLIVSDPDKAYQVLKAADFSVKLTDVFA